MKDKWDKLKIMSDVIKNNWPLIIIGLTALSSLSTNAIQYFTKAGVEQELVATQNQVTAVASHFTATTTPKIVVRESPCGNCIKRIEKLEKWH